MLGDCHRADQALSATLSETGAEQGAFLAWKLDRERRRIDRRHRMHRLYSFLRHATKPKLVSNNVGIWRSDFERVNGFDENFRNWGCEDDDLGRRLRRAGVCLDSILPYTRLVHLWHPRENSTTERWRDGANVRYYLRPAWLTRCRNGMTRRPPSDLMIRIVGRPAQPEQAHFLWRQAGFTSEQFRSAIESTAPCEPAEVEILFLPGTGGFSGNAEYQVLVMLDDSPVPTPTLTAAHRIITDRPFPGRPAEIQFPLARFAEAIDAVV